MPELKYIFNTPEQYAIWNGFSEKLFEEDITKAKDRLINIEKHLNSNITIGQIEKDLFEFINQVIELQNNMPEHTKDAVLYKCENISQNINNNKILIKIITQKEKYIGRRIDFAIQNKILSFNTNSLSKDEQINLFIQIREDILTLFEWYIDEITINCNNPDGLKLNAKEQRAWSLINKKIADGIFFVSMDELEDAINPLTYASTPKEQYKCIRRSIQDVISKLRTNQKTIKIKTIDKKRDGYVIEN